MEVKTNIYHRQPCFLQMKIRLLSDLHHEFMNRETIKSQPYLEYRGEDVLVLAGDIASGSSNVLKTLKLFGEFPQIIYISGNHEYYGSDIGYFDAQMSWKAREQGIDFLNPGSVIIDGVTFIGGNLWTNFREDSLAALSAKNMITDFKLIRYFTPEDAKNLYYRHFNYIKLAYENRTTEKVVIVTHFLPAVECISERFRGENLLNNYFANDLGDWIAGLSNVTWLFGHTHDSVKLEIGTTPLHANPSGYFRREVNSDFDPYYTVEV